LFFEFPQRGEFCPACAIVPSLRWRNPVSLKTGLSQTLFPALSVHYARSYILTSQFVFAGSPVLVGRLCCVDTSRCRSVGNRPRFGRQASRVIRSFGVRPRKSRVCGCGERVSVRDRRDRDPASPTRSAVPARPLRLAAQSPAHVSRRLSENVQDAVPRVFAFGNAAAGAPVAVDCWGRVGNLNSRDRGVTRPGSKRWPSGLRFCSEGNDPFKVRSLPDWHGSHGLKFGRTDRSEFAATIARRLGGTTFYIAARATSRRDGQCRRGPTYVVGCCKPGFRCRCRHGTGKRKKERGGRSVLMTIKGCGGASKVADRVGFRFGTASRSVSSMQRHDDHDDVAAYCCRERDCLASRYSREAGESMQPT